MPSLRYYFHQLRVLPMNEIVRRAVDIGSLHLRNRTRKVQAFLFGTGLSDREFFLRAFGASFPDEAAMMAHFRQHRAPSFFPDPASLSGLSEPERASVIRDADRTCAHVFDLLGSGEVDLGNKINWHRDFKTGYEWNAGTYFTDIGIPCGEADIKVPWELSRFSYAVTLGQAYWLTRDEKYSREFADQVNDWIDSNKAQFGVNWACTMDVGIRACNWIAGFGFFRSSALIDDAFLFKFLKSLYQHGLHIRANLEYSATLTSNHYLANIAGLAYAGTLFPEFREAGEWRTFAIQELTREMEKQVYPDGCDFEASACYHRLVLELFFFPTLVVVQNDQKCKHGNFRDITEHVFGKPYAERLQAMFTAVLHLLSPTGMMPQLGDNDSGRLHVWANRTVLDMRYLLPFAAIFFRDHRYKIREFGFCPDALWVFGEAGRRMWDCLPEQTLRNIASRSFTDTGWYVMRNGRDCIVLSCGPNGQNSNGGHAHNDKLSFTLCLDGRDVIVDPGTFVYTPAPVLRNLFRSTASHNTVMVNGLEQNRFDQSGLGLFQMADQSRPQTLIWETGQRQDLFSGEHSGFDHAGFHHQRDIVFDKEKRALEIRDTVQGLNPVSVALFHLAPDVAVKTVGRTFRAGSAIISFEGESRVTIEQYQYSAEYGQKEACACIRVHFGHSLTTRFALSMTSEKSPA